MIHTRQFDPDAVIGHRVYALCFMHSLSAMILKYQQGKQEARLRRMRAGLPHSPRDRGRISGFHNFTIYAILYSGREREKERESVAQSLNMSRCLIKD